MSKYVVVSDHSGKGDLKCIEAVCKVLTDAGHEAESGGVDSNSEARLRQEGKDTIGVFLVNGICIGTIASLNTMVNSGHCSQVIIGIPKPIMSEPFNVKENLDNPAKKPVIAHDDNFTKDPKVLAMSGKYTVEELFNQFEHMSYAYGEDCEEVGKSVLNGGSSGSGGEDNSTSSTGEGSVMSGWESITDLLKPLDGEAMVVVRGDAVIIKRIYPPEATKLWVYEGINIVADSVKISDYSPEIYNTFTIHWGASFENELEASFEKHKELFGERKTEVNAVYEVPLDGTESEDDTTTGTDKDKDKQGEDQSEDDGGLFGFVTGFLGGDDETTKQQSGTSQDLLNSQGTDTETGEDTEQTTKEVPITDEADAYLFALKQVGKARRKDGHKVECKVIGNKRFEVGEWCRVYIPSFNEDSIMFISKVSHDSSADNEWITSLTLVDYPPSLGSGQSNTPKSESNDDSSSDDSSQTEGDEQTDGQEGQEGQEGSDSGSGTDGSDQQGSDQSSQSGGN